MISLALSGALERNRSALNGRWPPHRGPAEAAAFLSALRANLDAPVAAAAATAPGAEDAVCVALFDVALVLWRHATLGADPAADAGAALFQRVLPANPRLLSRDPAAFAGAFANAIVELRRSGPVDASAWAAAVADVAALADDLPALRDAGLVLAWRHGLTHARDAALAAFDRLPAPLAGDIGARCFLRRGAPAEVRAAVRRRWGALPGTPSGALELVAFAGAHVAFGGPFVRPPAVRTANGRLLAGHDDAWWTIHADDFGVVLRPAAPGDVTAPREKAEARVTTDGTVWWGVHVRRFPAAARATSWAATDDTLAVACSDSHRVRLFAVRGGAA